MSDNAAPTVSPSQHVLNGHEDARAFVRLLQCLNCSRPFRNPVTLPCGNSLCRACLPPSYVLENVTYPISTLPRQAINCPFPYCPYQIHALEECSVNVVFGKVLEVITSEIFRFSETFKARPVTIWELRNPISRMLDETSALEEDIGAQLGSDVQQIEGGEKILEPHIEIPTPIEAVNEEKAYSVTVAGGRLVATYQLAERGALPFTSDLEYGTTEEFQQEVANGDTEAFESIRTVAQKELDCHVCYNLMLDPVTTPCGHTFCRKCLKRILDHSSICPVCRRRLPLSASLDNQPSDKYLCQFMISLYPEEVTGRREAEESEERSIPAGFDTALFVVAATFPGMPLLLHVFEPRYRLMIRRALQSNGQFGVVPHNEHGIPQGHLGRTPFLQHGVMVHIEDYHVLPDGRSFLYCRGVSRFRILGHGMLDGYMVGRVQRVEDISIAEEGRIEREETSISSTGPEDPAHLDRMSTQQLLEVCGDFVRRARERSPPWLQPRIIEIYGEPPTDAAVFPFWFASVVPLHESEKYKLLPTTSVRERLKITAKWVHKIDAQRW